METLVDNRRIELNEGEYLVLIDHRDDKTLSLVICGESELQYLGCSDLFKYPLNCAWEFLDEDGEKHWITILARNVDCTTISGVNL